MAHNLLQNWLHNSFKIKYYQIKEFIQEHIDHDCLQRIE